MERVKPALALGAAVLLALLALALFRRAPEAPPGGRMSKAAPPAPPAPPTPGVAPAAPSRDDKEGQDSLGVPLSPARIAQGVEAKVREHGELLARLKGPLSESDREKLSLRINGLASEIGLWTARLIDHKDFRHKAIFAEMFRGNAFFKHEAAGYLAALPGDAGFDVLLDGLRGADLYARSAAAVALEPHLLKRTEVVDDLRAALRKALSDDLRSADADKAEYGASGASARDLAVKLRGTAVRVLTRMKDLPALPFLLDLETGKDGVGWWGTSGEDVDALYRLFAQHPPPGLSERMTVVVDAHLTDEKRPGVESLGNPVAAALLLAALGRGGKLEDLRARTRDDFQAARAVGETRAIAKAESLLLLRDTHALDWLLERLTSPDERVRNRAVNVLTVATGRELVPSRELQGAGGAEDQARWSEARRRWSEWWTANRQSFQLSNPYTPP